MLNNLKKEKNDDAQSSDVMQKTLLVLKSKNAMLVGALLFGIVIGIFFGWQVWPVQWKDADVEHLRLDLQTEWVRLVAYGYSGGLIDEIGVTARLDTLGESVNDAIINALADPQSDRTAEALLYIQNFYGIDLSGIDTPDTVDPADTEGDPDEEESGSGFGDFLKWGGIILAVLIVSGVAVYFYSNREKEDFTEGSSLSSYLTEQFGNEEEVEKGAAPGAAARSAVPPAAGAALDRRARRRRRAQRPDQRRKRIRSSPRKIPKPPTSVSLRSRR